MDPKFCVLTIWIYTCLASFVAVNCASIIPVVELDALLQFKLNYIAKGSQQLLPSWDTGNANVSRSVCKSWVGIACTASTSASGYLHIQSINLASFGLKGSIAPHLGNLTFLSTLNLSHNAFTGIIPPQLVGCTSLQFLDLVSNRITSPIPLSLTSLPVLKFWAVCDNSFSGPIPADLFTNMSASLRVLALCHNAFTGSIPPNLHAANLQQLLLYENNLTGVIPPSLGNFSDLRLLHLAANEFTGPIPAELGMLYNLQVLRLDFNNLTGAIFPDPSFENFTNLETLGLSFNQLTGPCPTFQLGHLEVLYLSVNKLTGAIPTMIGNLSSLQELELGVNLFSGTLPVELGRLHNLTHLLLNRNNFTGVIPSSLGNCSTMFYLDLSFNQLTGGIPASFSMLGQLDVLGLVSNHLSGLLQHLDFSNFTKLTVLGLSNNQLGGSLVPINFSKLQQIGVLAAGSNQLTGEIPWDSLVNCSSIYVLDLSNNMLSGSIPSILGRFRFLQFLYLNGNLLWGAIPESSEVNNLSLLELDLSSNHLNGSLPSSLAHALVDLAGYLDLSHNNFSGSLPPWLGQLDKVVGMNLSHNSFAGSIPASLGDCAALVILVLSNNHLSGDLPLKLGSLRNLQILDISYNNLSGMLPSFLGSGLLQLQMLNVSFNNFTGPIPTDEGVFKHLSASSFQGNPGLCGRLLNKACIGDGEVLQKQHHHHSLLQLKTWRGILLISLVSGLVLTGLMLLLVIARRRCFSQPVDASSSILAHEGKIYTAKELIEATQGYSEGNILGQGGLGVVYKGVLSDGHIVAIKKLKDIYNGSEEALLKEMHILSKLRHRNLVQILGCVLNLDIKALVLQYMENGSLEEYLGMHIQSQYTDQESEQKKLSSLRYWLMVNRVTMGIAHALAYLHHGYGESIIHGDVKPGNILLDSDLEPHLADFGLAKLIQKGAEAVSLTSDFKGSIGYMAPEYAYAARVTTKVDVYSFGVVVLRMLTGKSPTQVVPEGTSLHEWVKSKLAIAERAASWEELLDAALVLKMPVNINDDERGKKIVDKEESVRGLLRMGLACTSHHPEDRPTIHQVLAYLTSRSGLI